MRKLANNFTKSALLVALPFLCGGCGSAVRALLAARGANATSSYNNGGAVYTVPPNVPAPGITPSSAFIPPSMAITSGGVPLEKIALPKPSASAIAEFNAQSQAAEIWAAKMRRDFLPDANSGAGFVVCEPILEGASTRANSERESGAKAFDAAAFGAGCSRWLFVQVGGRGELGKTPIWGAIEDVRVARKLPNLRLNAAQALPFTLALGATHAATARFSGDEKSGVLTYEIWRAPQQKSAAQRVGAPFVMRGTAAQIVAQLPQVAQQMASRLKASTRGIEKAVGTDASGLAFLGKVAWKKATCLEVLSESDTEKLRVLSLKVPLAALLYLRSGNLQWGDPRRRAAIRAALDTAPDNVLLLADAVWKDFNDVRPYFARIDVGLQKYPANQLVNFADMTRWNSLGDLKKQRIAAESMISCAPQSFMAWEALRTTAEGLASTLRRGRYYQNLDAREQRFVERLYEIQMYCALHWLKITPTFAAWTNVAKAASFAGHRELADFALWKAIAAERRADDALSWGFQMYQNKWFPDEDRMKTLVKLAYSDPDLMRWTWSDAIDGLSGLDLDAESQRQLMFTVSQFEQQLKKNPKNANVHWAWACLARDRSHNGSKDDVAIREFRAVIALMPNNPVPMQQLGEMLHFKKRQYRQAEKLYRDALALNPDYPDTLKTLGNLTYYVHGDAAGAEKLYRRAIALKEDGLYRTELARLLLDKGRKAEALKETMKGIEDGFTDKSSDVFARLGIDPDAEQQKFLAKQDQKIFQF